MDQAASSFTREALLVDGDEVTETLLQIARAEASAFGFIRRVWRIERRGRYSWAAEAGVWKIIRVQVLTETVRSDWNIGRTRRRF